MQSGTTPKPRLILHGGMAKTGTASIQIALCEPGWREVLDAVGVRFMRAVSAPWVLPENRGVEVNEEGEVINFGNCSRYFNALRGAPAWRSASEHAAAVEAMTTDIRTIVSGLPDGFSILISAEAVGDTAVWDRDALQRTRDLLLGFFSDVSVVFYLREPLSYACSRVQQNLKAGFPMQRALQGALTGCDSMRAIRHVEEVFGEANLTIRSFDPALMTSGDVVADFASNILGIPNAAFRELRAQRADRNLGLPMELLETLLRFYSMRAITTRNIRRGFGQRLGKIQWAGTKFSPAFFSDDDRGRLLDTANKVRAAVRERMGHDPFPSYRPFRGGAWHASEAGPEIHERNFEILRDMIIEIMEKRAAADAPGDTGGAAPDWEGGTIREGETAQDALLRLLGELYDLCDPGARRREDEAV